MPVDIEFFVERAEYLAEEEFIMFEFFYEGGKYLGQMHRSDFHDRGDVVSEEKMHNLALSLVDKKLKWQGFDPDLQEEAKRIARKNGFN